MLVALRRISVARRTFLQRRCCQSTSDDDSSSLELRRLRELRELHSETTPSKYDDCTSVGEVLNLLHGARSEMRQALFALVTLQNGYIDSYVSKLARGDVDRSPELMVRDYRRRISEDPRFVAFLSECSRADDATEAATAAACLSHLCRLGFAPADLNDLFGRLLDRCATALREEPHTVSSDTLVHFTMAICSENVLWFAGMARHAIPRLCALLDDCETVEDFKNITNAINNVHLIVMRSMLESYKKKCEQLINSNTLTSADYKVILKTLQFLNLSHWSRENALLIRNLCDMIRCEITNMDHHEVITLHRIFRNHMEPGYIVFDLKKKVNNLLEQLKNDDRIEVFLSLPDLMFCQLNYSPVRNRQILKKLIHDSLVECFPSMLPALFDCIRFLKMTDNVLCDMYWKQIETNIRDNCKSDKYIIQQSFKYLYFNNNLRGAYRNIHFEKFIMNTLLDRMHTGIVDVVPWKFCRMFAFIVGFGITRPHMILPMPRIEELIEKLERMSGQLTASDVFFMARGVEIYAKLQNYSERNYAQLKRNMSRITNVLDSCILRIVTHETLSVVKLNLLFKCYCSYNNGHASEQFEKIVLQYTNVRSDQLSSQSIKEGIYNFMKVNVFVNKWTEQVVDYMMKQEKYLMGELAKSILYMCFVSGYTPDNLEPLRSVSSIINRDQDVMSSLSVIQASIALLNYGALSDDMVQNIFSLDFMERLDLEIENCYSEISYPKRLRSQLMVLNRGVCLELPQYNIPWFHQKYIEEIKLLTPLNKSYFYNDVLKSLSKITNNNEDFFKMFHFTPYGYLVEFYLQVNKSEEKFLPVTTERDDAKKIAILLQPMSSFIKIYDEGQQPNCFKVKLVKNGSAHMKLKHLELLGYEVIEISQILWNSMHMAEQSAKVEFLYEKIFNNCDR